MLHGVVFRWEPSHIYRSGILNTDQIAQFINHADVDLEAVALALPGMDETPVTEPAVEVREALPDKAATAPVNNTEALRPVLPPQLKPADAPEAKPDWNKIAAEARSGKRK